MIVIDLGSEGEDVVVTRNDGPPVDKAEQERLRHERWYEYLKRAPQPQVILVEKP
jgi:hypothetical protein